MTSTKSNVSARTIEDYIEQLPDEALRLLRAYLTLDEPLRKYFSDAVGQIGSLSEDGRKSVGDIVTNMPLKPFGKPCPYCGRD